MSGAGLGSAAGTAIGVALAPETGGLSLAIPAIMGAAGGFAGGKLTHSHNGLMDALMGGISGGLGGASGLGSIMGNVGGVGDSIAGATPGWLGGTADASSIGGGLSSLFGGANAASQGIGAAASGANDLASTIGAGMTGNDAAMGSKIGTDFMASNPMAASGANVAQQAANTGSGSGILNYLGKQNPLNLALAGGAALSGIQSLMPHKQVNTAQNRADVLASDPGMSSSLPKYSMNNTATPYQGDWNTYGMTPHTPQYNAQPQPYAKGGMVKMAMGGVPPQMPAQQASMTPQMPSMPQSPVNPLSLKKVHDIGFEIGKRLKKSHLFTGHGKVHGTGGGQDDKVPAKLSQGEFVLPADIVSHLGDGSTDAGANNLTKMMHNVRKHKAVKGFPPRAKNPLKYLPKGSI